MTEYREFEYEIEWERKPIVECPYCGEKHIVKQRAHFIKECVSEFDALTYVVDWMQTKGINSENIKYCIVEEVLNIETFRNVLVWIGE